MPANEKRRYVMTSDFRQYIAEYTVANFWRYPIRRRVAYASALECILICIALDKSLSAKTAAFKYEYQFLHLKQMSQVCDFRGCGLLFFFLFFFFFFFLLTQKIRLDISCEAPPLQMMHITCQTFFFFQKEKEKINNNSTVCCYSECIKWRFIDV